MHNADHKINRDETADTPSKQNAILVFRIGQLGDTLISMPAISAIRDMYPQCRLVLLTDRHPNQPNYSSSWDILGPTGWFDDVIFYEPSGLTINTIKNAVSIAKQVITLSPIHIYNLSPQRSLKQALRDRMFFSVIAKDCKYSEIRPVRVDRHKKNGALSQSTPEWRRLLSIVRSEQERDSDFILQIPAPEKLRAAHILSESRFADIAQRMIAIGPGSKMPAKRWPKEFYVKLGTMLLGRYSDRSLAVFGGKEDADLGNELCARWGKRAINLAGKLSIYGSAAALERCEMYIGNDTGTMHLAAIVGKPCLAIFSSRDYRGKWEPYGDDHMILRTDPECAGCMLEVCTRNMECLTAISPDDVMEKANLVMGARENKA